MSYGVGRRCRSDLALLWLWCRPAAIARIRPLAWEPPYATGAAQKMAKDKKKKKLKTRTQADTHMPMFIIIHNSQKVEINHDQQQINQLYFN